MEPQSSIDFLPPVSSGLLATLAAAAIVAFLLLRLAAAPPAANARRWGLLMIRALAVVTLLAILANPVRVDELPGAVERPRVLYLLDVSESMSLGDETTRFEEATRTIDEVHELLPSDFRPHLSAYCFGRRLSAIESPEGLDPQAIPPPTDSDTQLQSALRQLTGRFGPVAPASVVLFSDGRAREPAGVEQIARRYAEMKVPVHTMCFGATNRGGDASILNMIVPSRVRKYSRVDAHVFIRSFGYDGRRSELLLSAVGDDDTVDRQLNRLPIMLQSGVQSFHLTFQSETRPERVRASIEPLPDELASNNNQFTADVGIDRTKIRVLHIGGGSDRMLIQKALAEDPDIDCALRSSSIPSTKVELYAYDALILSNIASDRFNEQRFGWIQEWIRERGAGLCMIGGPQSFASGGWRNTLIADMLPLAIASADNDWIMSGGCDIQPTLSAPPHPIWSIVNAEKQNLAILERFPDGSGVHRHLREKTGATVLATTNSVGHNGPMPVIAVGPYGKGRTMAMATRFGGPSVSSSQGWTGSDDRYQRKFWRNVVYWLTENSAVGRRRLMAATDKLLYRPGETILLEAAAFDESAAGTMDYRLDVVIEPRSADFDLESDYSAVRWPDDVERTSGEDNPCIAWGEELTMLPRPDRKDFHVELPISDDPASGSKSQALRIEVSAYEDFALVDSMSTDVQILDDPFEQQNPLPNPELLEQVASLSGGRVLADAESLSAMLGDLSYEAGPPVVKKTPLWSRWWLLGVLLALLTVELCWRRFLGLA